MNVLLCPVSSAGFSYPAIAVGLELRDRGHRVSLLARDTATVTGGLASVPVPQYGPRGSLAVSRWHVLGREQYLTVVRAARDLRADVLVTSVLCHGALLAGEVLDLPVVVLGLAAYLWRYRGWAYPDPERHWRTGDMLRLYRQAREQSGLGAAPAGFPLAGDAHILRGDPALECPQAMLPPGVRHAGPCAWEPDPDPAEVAQTGDRLDRIGKPVIYVHLGRIFNGSSMWPMLNAVFSGGPFQAVVELGRTADERPAAGADIVVVRKPWMRPFVERAGLVVTNGTSAPVLTALLHGRPLAVAPAGSEQPVLARACVRAGVAVYLPGQDATAWSAVLSSAWADRGLRDQAAVLGTRLARPNDRSRAAGIVEAVASSRVAGSRVASSRAANSLA